MTRARTFAPTASIFLLTFVAALPWGLPPMGRVALSLLPIIAMHYWVVCRDGSIPEWQVFACGLALDFLTDGPLGYWALIYLVADLTVLGARMSLRSRFSRRLWLLLTLAASAALAWGLASAYLLTMVDWLSFGAGAGLASMSALLFFLLAGSRDEGQRTGGNVRLERGI